MDEEVRMALAFWFGCGGFCFLLVAWLIALSELKRARSDLQHAEERYEQMRRTIDAMPRRHQGSH